MNHPDDVFHLTLMTNPLLLHVWEMPHDATGEKSASTQQGAAGRCDYKCHSND